MTESKIIIYYYVKTETESLKSILETETINSILGTAGPLNLGSGPRAKHEQNRNFGGDSSFSTRESLRIYPYKKACRVMYRQQFEDNRSESLETI